MAPGSRARQPRRRRPAAGEGLPGKPLPRFAGGAPVTGLLLCLALATTPAAGQDANIKLHPDTAEALLAHAHFEIVQARDTRFEGDRTQQALLEFSAAGPMLVKWARAPRGGGKFNNQPRYELAAYRLQKLFLEPGEYVVPPTAVRCFPLGWYRSELERGATETVSGTGNVMVVLQYWLWGVTDEGVFDEERFARDTLYARHLANLNVFTYLVRHNDANKGNVLVSQSADNPRVFAVDNGVAFASDVSNRGYEWRRLRVDRIPRETVERLRALTRQELDRQLGVLAQFELRGTQLATVDPGENLDPGKGVRRRDDVVQLGLSEREISAVWRRLERLLDKVDSGDLGVF